MMGSYYYYYYSNNKYSLCAGDWLVADEIVSLLFQFDVTIGLSLGKWYVSKSNAHGLWTWLRKPPTKSSTLYPLMFVGHMWG